MSTRDDLAGRDLEHTAPDVLDDRRGVRRTNRALPVSRRVPAPTREELAPIPATESRPAMLRHAFTEGGHEPMFPRLDGTHVQIVAHRPYPVGNHEDSEMSQPQPPTFRAPPEPWIEPEES